jgi:hypothetical protein
MNIPNVPGELATAAALAMGTVIAVLWRQLTVVKKDERDDCKEQIAALNKTLDEAKSAHERVVQALIVERDEYKDRWIKEMHYGADLALLPQRPNEPGPDSLPPPAYEEPMQVRRQREEIQREVLHRRRREFEASSSSLKAVAPPEVLRRGMRNHPLVMQVQTFLRGKNLYRDPIDGNFSGETEAAVKHLQDIAGIAPTGIVDTPTWGALFQSGFQIPGSSGSRKMPSRPR